MINMSDSNTSKVLVPAVIVVGGAIGLVALSSTLKTKMKTDAAVDKIVTRQDGKTDRVEAKQDGKSERVLTKQQQKTCRKVLKPRKVRKGVPIPEYCRR